MTEIGALVSAQELLGEQSARAGVPVGQYSAGNAKSAHSQPPPGQGKAPAAASAKPASQSRVWPGV